MSDRIPLQPHRALSGNPSDTKRQTQNPLDTGENEPTDDAPEQMKLESESMRVPEPTFLRLQALRRKQRQDGKLQEYLSPVQQGLEDVQTLHHVSINFTLKSGTPSYRVRICKTCSKTDTLLELGTYVDKESAILVNDVHEILHDRCEKLHVLLPSDAKYFHTLTARRYIKGKLEEVNIMSTISDKLNQKSTKKRSTAKRARTSSPTRDVESEEYPTSNSNPTSNASSSLSSSSSPLTAVSTAMGPTTVESLLGALLPCCESLAPILVTHAMSSNVNSCQSLIRELLTQLYTGSQPANVTMNMSGLSLSVLRCAVCAYAPIKTPNQLREVMTHLDKEMEARRTRVDLEQEQPGTTKMRLSELAGQLCVNYNIERVIFFASELQEFAHKSLDSSWNGLNTIKFPRYAHPHCDEGFPFDRVYKLRGVASCAYSRFDFIWSMANFVEGLTIDGSYQRTPGHSVLEVIGCVRRIMTWILFTGIDASFSLFYLTDDDSVLDEAILELEKIEPYVHTFSVHIQSVARQDRLNYELMVYDNLRSGLGLGLEAPKLDMLTRVIGELYGALIDAIPRIWPEDIPPNESNKIVNPFTMCSMVEVKFLMHMVLLRVLLIVPEVYFRRLGSIDVGEYHFTIVQAIRETEGIVSSFLQWNDATGIGMVFPQAYLQLYHVTLACYGAAPKAKAELDALTLLEDTQTHKVRSLQACLSVIGLHDIFESLRALAAKTSHLLLALGERFVLAQDLYTKLQTVQGL